jgi:hypothetical protein
MADEGNIFQNSINDAKNQLKEIFDSFAKNIETNINISEVIGKISEVDDAATEVIKKFGTGRDNVLAIKQGLSDAVKEVEALGGNFGNVKQIQLDISETLNRNLVLMSDSYQQLYAAGEVTSLSVGTIVETFKDAGYSLYQAGDQMQKVVDIAISMGVNVEEVSRQVSNNIGLLDKYGFENGVQGLAKMAANAALMRVNVSSISGMLEKAFEPEGAITMAATLQRLGAQQADLLNPLRLMDLSQNNPEEMLKVLADDVQRYVQQAEDGQFKISDYGRRVMREYEKATGVNYEQLVKMAKSTAEIQDKMGKIAFPTKFNLSEEQQKMIASMAEMKGGEYKISMTDEKGEKVEKSITQLSEDDIQRLVNPQAPKTMEELAFEQLTTLKAIEVATKAPASRTGYAVAGMGGVDKFIGELRGVSARLTNVFNVKELSVKDVRKELTTDFGLIGEGLKKLYKGDTSGSLEQFGKGVDGLTKYMNKAMLAVEEEGRKQFKGTPTGNVIQKVVEYSDKNLGTGNIKVQNNDKTLDVKDFMIKTLPEDSIVMAGGTSLTENKNTTINENRNTSDINLNINISAPQGTDRDNILSAVKESLRNTGVVQELSKTMGQVKTNYNLTT